MPGTEKIEIDLSINMQAEGYGFLNNRVYRDNELLELFKNVQDFSGFCHLNTEVNGVYSIYILQQNRIWLYVSPGGFHKLFYARGGTGFRIANKASDLSVGILDQNAVLEYRSSLICWGRKTLFEGVFSVEPGSAVCLDNMGVESRKTFNYAIKSADLFIHPFDKLLLTGKTVFDNVIDRMIEFLGGRQAVIPLSGGYDSRFILAALVSKKYKNVIAITYGVKNNPELENAEKVAKCLGVKWHFIPYDVEKADAVLSDNKLDSYFEFLVNGNSFPCLHEIVALKHLKSNDFLEPDAVFIPGHSGDMLGGSQYIKVVPPDLVYRNLSGLLLKTKFDASIFPKSFIAEKKAQFFKLISDTYSPDLIPATIFEDIDLSEKLSKHILNAANAYVFYGYTCYFPYWDKELIDFFRKVPASYKLEKQLYDTILKEYFFNPFGIAFEKELHPSLLKLRIQKLKNLMRQFLPLKTREYFKRKNDFYLYQHLTRQWRLEMEQNRFISTKHDFSYNSIIAHWVIYRLQNQVSFSE